MLQTGTSALIVLLLLASGVTVWWKCGYQVHQGQHGAANLATGKVIFCSNEFYIRNGYIMWLTLSRLGKLPSMPSVY